MLDKIKQALRITHSKLDDDIEGIIEAAKQELIRMGIAEEVVEDCPEIVYQCIKVYAQCSYTDDEKQKEMYWKSFQCQADAIRKSWRYADV